MSPTRSYKITVVGNGGVGKTTLIIRYTEKRFRESYIPTIGVQWTVKNLRHKGYDVILTLWDIAGQEEFKKIRSKFYEGSDASIIVFDITDLSSFNQVEMWLKEVRQFCGNIPYILLGNKIDLEEDRKVTKELIQSLIKRHHLPYFETSAKTGENVIDMFNAIIEKLV
ncbi:MAG: Rab family GTPase [Candidatus Helarchaeota archaeon]